MMTTMTKMKMKPKAMMNEVACDGQIRCNVMSKQEYSVCQ